jgi:hypothetical protein
MWVKIPLYAVVAGTLCMSPAGAEEMRAIDARDFIVGDHFAYTCFDGTTGDGRIYADGSVAGYIQLGGTKPRRHVVLPAGTLKMNGERYCASLRGVRFAPCFKLERTSAGSFRGSVLGLGFAYCTFTRIGRTDLQEFANYRLRGVRPSPGWD